MADNHEVKEGCRCMRCAEARQKIKKVVGHAEMNKLPFIIAVDFDGTLVTDKFPEIGEKNEKLFANCIKWKLLGYKLILWTCRDNDTEGYQLNKAVEYCRSQGVEFDAVNRNIPEVIALFNNDTRKVYANLYIDDKSVSPGIPDVIYNWEPADFKPWKMKKPVFVGD